MDCYDDPTSTDAEWKSIQQNTFTRWVNEHLKRVNKQVYDVETDFCDGVLLIALLEVLSRKMIDRYNKRPTFRPQKIENIAIALKFVEDEQIRLVNIDASDILKGNLKLILGLLWTLILKYSISIPLTDDDTTDENSKQTLKSALMRWLNTKMPEKPLTNFIRDWTDGTAIAALVNAVAPGLYPDWKNCKRENALENASKAMELAEKWLDIPQILMPDEMTNPNVDEMSIMTYVSQFIEAKPKPGTPLGT